MNAQQLHDPQMMINDVAALRGLPFRQIQVNSSPALPESPEAKTASRLVAACRANVDFLNRHLARFEKYLTLPAVSDNALYLAYTISVKDTAPFAALELRLKLEKRGIETRSHFSFTDDNLLTVNRGAFRTTERILSLGETFCIGCHHLLTIPDLQQIVSSLSAAIDELAAAAN
jgi:hypothetical protein